MLQLWPFSLVVMSDMEFQDICDQMKLLTQMCEEMRGKLEEYRDREAHKALEYKLP